MRTQVIVKAPLHLHADDIDRFVQLKAPWIRKKQAEQQAMVDSLPQWRFEEGAVFPYLGKQLRIRVSDSPDTQVDRASLHIQEGQMELHCLLAKGRRIAPERRVRDLLSNWYQEQAGRLLVEKSHIVADLLGVRLGRITLKVTKSKWGHCTPGGDIQYNWQIVLAPEAVVDYLVAHEVSHRLELNHSDRFWRWVAKVCPGYKAQRQWLKVHGQKLVI